MAERELDFHSVNDPEATLHGLLAGEFELDPITVNERAKDLVYSCAECKEIIADRENDMLHWGEDFPPWETVQPMPDYEWQINAAHEKFYESANELTTDYPGVAKMFPEIKQFIDSREQIVMPENKNHISEQPPTYDDLKCDLLNARNDFKSMLHDTQYGVNDIANVEADILRIRNDIAHHYPDTKLGNSWIEKHPESNPEHYLKNHPEVAQDFGQFRAFQHGEHHQSRSQENNTGISI